MGLTKEQADKIKVKRDTVVGQCTPDGTLYLIQAEYLKKWAYRRLETWPDLFEACQTLLDAYLDSLNDNKGCKCQRCFDASVKARQALNKAMQSG